MGTVSVIIPSFNAAGFICDAIRSVLAQSWANREIIVVDDGSVDGSATHVKERFGAHVVLIEQSNQGAAVARSAGAARATGDYLLFLDADDLLEPRYLEGLLDAAVQENADLAIGNFRIIWPNGGEMDCAPKWSPRDLDAAIAGVLSDDWVPVHAVLWRTSFFRSIGGWRRDLSVNDDGELIFRALMANPRVARSTLDRAVYRQHDGERVSTNVARSAMLSRLIVIEEAVKALGDRARRGAIQRALSHNSYDTSCWLYRLGYDDLGARCEKAWRDLGPPYVRTGSPANRVMSTVLGLKGKTMLALWLRQ